MCQQPIRLPTGVQVSCGHCQLCRGNRVRDFVGRCIAEQSTSSGALALTLTYRGDTVQATSLYYYDVQLMLKRLRKDGYSIRYMCAGEIGERKGRAHWHIILFFQGPIPELQIERRINWKYWPHGFVYAQQANYAGFAYLLKYTLKEGDRQAGFKKILRLSKYPPIGAAYFRNLADRLVQSRLAIHTPEYSFSDVTQLGKDRRWHPRQFWLTNRSLELFLEYYCLTWQRHYGMPPPDTTFLWEKLYDPIATKEKALDVLDMEAQVELRKQLASDLMMNRPFKPSPFPHQTGFLLLPSGDLVTSYSNGTAILVKGGEKWQLNVNATESGSVNFVASQLSAAGLNYQLASAVRSWLSRERPDPCQPSSTMEAPSLGDALLTGFSSRG